MTLEDLGINFVMTKCGICGASLGLGYKITCSDDCHEKLIHRFEERFGLFKRVIDEETQIAYRVPIRDIIEKGLRQQDLKHYPELIPEES